MPELNVTPRGLELHGPGAGTLSDVPVQAIPFTMGQSLLNSILECVNNGGELQLSLGDAPTLHFDTASHLLTPPPEDYHYDLYVTKPYEFTRRAEKIPDTMFIPNRRQVQRNGSLTTSARSQSSRPSPCPPARPAPDSDIQALQNSLAAAEASRNHTNTMTTTTKGNQLIGTAVSSKKTPKSLPPSPGLSAEASPSPPNAASATQQAVERAREQRFALVHELAVRDQKRSHLKAKWIGSDSDFENVLEKVADYDADTRTFAMKRNYWKELDVWQYKYQTKQDRYSAIDNAVRQYGRMRLAQSEVQWERLAPVEDRGKGNYLAILQKLTANKKAAALAPAAKAQSTDDESEGKGKGGTTRATTTSTAAVEAKKAATDARLKQIISKGGKKAATPKPAPAKAKDHTPARGGADKDKGNKDKDNKDKSKSKKALSAEFVDDSDSADEALSKGKPVKRAKPAAVPAPATTTASRARPAVAKTAASKRLRDDEDDDEAQGSSSASSPPPSKRVKVQPKPKLVPPSTGPNRNRATDSSQPPPRTAPANGPSSRGAGGRAKSTSPAKSSPLAVSPPTSVSDMVPGTSRRDVEPARERKDERKEVAPAKVRNQEPDRRSKVAAVNGTKRKADTLDNEPPVKRQAVLQETLTKASKFQSLYSKYHDLDTRMRGSGREPPEQVERLIRMRNELKSLKAEIYAETAAVA